MPALSRTAAVRLGATRSVRLAARTRAGARPRVTALAVALLAVACGPAGPPSDPSAAVPAPEPAAEAPAPADAPGALVVYSGRNEEFIGPAIAAFTAATGIAVDVRYADTAELAATLVEEGGASPADVYLAQDAGALGALEAAGLLAPLPIDVLERVDPAYRSVDGGWVGITGRVRVLVRSTTAVAESDLPASVTALVDPRWRGRIGWAPTNGSFQSFVTALRVVLGEEEARAWLEGMISNEVQAYEGNAAIVDAVARGEIDLGLTNHYYALRVLAEDPDAPVANHYLPGDVGGLVNVAGAGVLASSSRPTAALALVAFLLSDATQDAFATATSAPEFPLVAGIDAPDLPSLTTLDPPAIDLGRLADLQGTLALLRAVGALV